MDVMKDDKARTRPAEVHF